MWGLVGFVSLVSWKDFIFLYAVKVKITSLDFSVSYEIRHCKYISCLNCCFHGFIGTQNSYRKLVILFAVGLQFSEVSDDCFCQHSDSLFKLWETEA